MTIDEAIENERKIVEKCKTEYELECARYGKRTVESFEKLECIKVAEEHEQLADWLEELKALKNGLNIKCDSLNEALEKGKKVGYNKALDDFVKALQEKIEKDLSNPDLALECKKCGIWKNYDIEKIAEQLKAGVKE